MKIVEFGGDAATPQPGDADNWKRRSSAYPSFDKKPSHTDAPSLEALRAVPGASDAKPDMPAPASSSSSARPKIKIMEFNTGGAASGRAAPVASAAGRQDTAPAPAVKSTMKIMEFDDRAAPAARSAVASGRSGIKIVEYGETAKGSRS